MTKISPKHPLKRVWKSPPKRVPIEEKVTLNKFLLKKYTFTSFSFLVTKFSHPKVFYRGEHSHINREDYPFCVKDKFQNYPFLPKILFWHPKHVTRLPVKKVPFSHVFLVTHVYTVMFECPPPGVLVIIKQIDLVIKKQIDCTDVNNMQWLFCFINTGSYQDEPATKSASWCPDSHWSCGELCNNQKKGCLIKSKFCWVYSEFSTQNYRENPDSLYHHV